MIDLSTRVAAPIERVFDLARSINLHVVSAEGTGERAIGGVTSGLIALGETVTWSARHLGFPHSLTVQITAFDRPRCFRDSMVTGPFRRFDHDHFFDEAGGVTVMRDVFDYASPLGPLGRIADVLVVERHLRRFLAARAEVIRQAAETEDWRQYL